MIPHRKNFLLQQESVERIESALTMRGVRTKFMLERRQAAVLQGGTRNQNTF